MDKINYFICICRHKTEQMLRTNVLYIQIISNVFSLVNTLFIKNRTNFLNICLLFSFFYVMIGVCKVNTTFARCPQKYVSA